MGGNRIEPPDEIAGNKINSIDKLNRCVKFSGMGRVESNVFMTMEQSNC